LTAYTPTVTGHGTVATVSHFWKRQGDCIYLQSAHTLGTSTAVDAKVTLPTGLLIDTAKISTSSIGEMVGMYVVSPRGGGSLAYLSNYSGIVMFDGSDTDEIYFGKETGTATISKLQGNDYSSGQRIMYTAKLPIAGWNG
jgi:hypothetical protein